MVCSYKDLSVVVNMPMESTNRHVLCRFHQNASGEESQ